MADLRWMKFWPGNYLGDTGHLTLAEHGAYLMLLFHAWDHPTCSLPADPEWLKRRLRVDDEEFASVVQPVIEEFWIEEEGRLHQKRQRKEWFQAKASAERRSKSGKKAAKTRWEAEALLLNDFPDA